MVVASSSDLSHPFRLMLALTYAYHKLVNFENNEELWLLTFLKNVNFDHSVTKSETGNLESRHEFGTGLTAMTSGLQNTKKFSNRPTECRLIVLSGLKKSGAN